VLGGEQAHRIGQRECIGSREPCAWRRISPFDGSSVLVAPGAVSSAATASVAGTLPSQQQQPDGQQASPMQAGCADTLSPATSNVVSARTCRHSRLFSKCIAHTRWAELSFVSMVRWM
jgi:hypothetical protein